ncbi:MAG TPA: sulfotransferase [Mycobacteriales bacterium]
MTLQVIGAGMGRTGTNSLKLALERLLGAPCYHMREVFTHPEHVPVWHAAVRGEPVDWDALFEGYAATVDWPAAAFWPELVRAYPDALVLLSVRDTADAWWRSADATIFQGLRREPPADAGPAEWHAMVRELLAHRFTPDLDDAAAAMAAYEQGNAAVRAGVPAERLVEWRTGEGWEPLCAALGLPVPDEPFPHTNTTAEFQAMLRDRPPTV